MSKSSKGTDSRKNPSRGKKGGSGGMIDILAGADTRYPEHCSYRTLPGNGERPKNPFGRKMETLKVGKPVR